MQVSTQGCRQENPHGLEQKFTKIDPDQQRGFERKPNYRSRIQLVGFMFAGGMCPGRGLLIETIRRKRLHIVPKVDPMSMKNWPKEDRPREKLLASGARSLSTAELLAILLGTGDRATGRSALEHARDLIQCYGSLRGIGNAPAGEICKRPGIGEAKAARLYAALEIAKRMGEERISKGLPLHSSEDVFQHYHPRLRDVKRELFLVILLDSKNRIIREEQISEGSLDVSVVHPREVFNPVIRESAAAVVLVHNHPSGDPSPSPEDVRLTRRLVEVGNVLGVKILDHIIIGEGEYVSFHDRGLLSETLAKTKVVLST